jgi:hypothetical protein
MRPVMSVAWGLLALAVLAAAVLAFLLSNDGHGRDDAAPGRIAIGVLGDSDSAGYQNQVDYNGKALSPEHWVGGEFHAITLQWPEALAQLRGNAVDVGAHGAWGVPRWQSLTRLRRWIGQDWRGPHKQDHRHVLAWPSGCSSLMTQPWAQAPQLRDLIDREPERWRQGIVVIRIGVNDFGKEETLDALAKDRQDVASLKLMDACAAQYRAAVAHLRERHPHLRFVLVGIANNAHWPPYHARWQSAAEQANIEAGLKHFDGALRRVAEGDSNIAFFDDQAWFDRLWGPRDAQGLPAYKTPLLAPGVPVTNSAGDAPTHAVLGNKHAGLAWNLWWCQSLVLLLRERWALEVKPIDEAELHAWVARWLSQAPEPKR